MIQYEQIKEVHLELSTNCNASCPLCPRNFYGYPHNGGYPITELSLADVQHILSPEFLQQLKIVQINGNLGDFILARDALAIVKYFRESNPLLRIDISTNAGARPDDFWRELAQYKPVVRFCIDGLEDTHSLYRRDTQFQTVIKHARAYIDAGGHAIWKMIKFDHNQHQISECRALSWQLGFAQFDSVDHGRNNGPVFDREGKHIYSIGDTMHYHDPATLIDWRKQSIQKQEHYNHTVHEKITCDTITKKTIYISAAGDVYPCCYLGFFPRTYGSDLYHGNDQIKHLLNGVENNAKEKPLRECIEWFNSVEESWKADSFESGKLWRCNHHCGSSPRLAQAQIPQPSS